MTVAASPAPLPRSVPEAEGIDSAGIEAFLDAMEADDSVELHSLVIVRHGKVVADGWWKPYAAQQPHLLYSLSKSFTSTAAAFAVAEGLLDLDAPVVSYFPEYDQLVTDPRSRAMLVRHIAAMASGHHEETLERVRHGQQDPVLGFLLLPPEHDPGTWFAYNQPCTYTLAAIIQRESGQSMVEYLTPRLFEPLGIVDVGWQSDERGRELGFTGLHATTGAIARLGLLYLQEGRWNDQQLISPEWVAEATSVQVANPEEENPDWRQGYGFQFWRGRHGYRGDGAYGQFCVVLPEQDTVVAMTSQTENMQAVLQGLWDHLLPAIGAQDRKPSAAAMRLFSRLGSASLPPLTLPVGARPAATDEALAFVPSDGNDQPTITAVELVTSPTGSILTLVEDTDRLETPIAGDGWTSNAAVADHGRSGVPIAACGGWSDADTFVAELIFLQTPHRLRLRCSVRSGTVDVRWVSIPLRSGRLADLQMPRS